MLPMKQSTVEKCLLLAYQRKNLCLNFVHQFERLINYNKGLPLSRKQMKGSKKLLSCVLSGSSTVREYASLWVMHNSPCTRKEELKTAYTRSVLIAKKTYVSLASQKSLKEMWKLQDFCISSSEDLGSTEKISASREAFVLHTVSWNKTYAIMSTLLRIWLRRSLSSRAKMTGSTNSQIYSNP